MLDPCEAKNFLAALCGCMEDDRKHNYCPERIDKIISEFDADNDSFLSKSEMAVLVKKTFSTPKDLRSQEQDLTFDQKQLLENKQKTLDLNKSSYRLRIWIAIILGIVVMQTYSETSISI